MTYKIYLAGGIDKSLDFGKSHREAIKMVVGRIPNIEFLDPLSIEANKRQIEKKENLKDLMYRIGYKEALEKHIIPLAEDDIRAVVKADGIIVILNGCAGCGTSGEVTLANYLRKPIWGIFTGNDNYYSTPPWILSRVNAGFYQSLNDLKKNIEEFLTR